MKNVIVLSTFLPVLGVTRDDGKSKPAMLKLYDFTKGGTDIVDQRMGSYSTNTKSRKWTMTALCYILDTARVNSQTLWSLNNLKNPIKVNSFDYGYELCMALIVPQIQGRELTFLSMALKTRICTFLKNHLDGNELDDNAANQRASKFADKKRRCHFRGCEAGVKQLCMDCKNTV
jgi:hypothetical protein